MVSERARNVVNKIYHGKNGYLSTFKNASESDFNILNDFISRDPSLDDKMYLGIVTALYEAYEKEDLCDNFRKRFYFAVGFSTYYENVKDDSLDSDSSILRNLKGTDREMANLGFLDGRSQLYKSMKEESTIKVKQYGNKC